VSWEQLPTKQTKKKTQKELPLQKHKGSCGKYGTWNFSFFLQGQRVFHAIKIVN
jgi:hypothetical protein